MYALSAKTKVCPNRTNQDAKYLAECNCYVPEILGGVFHSEGLGCLGERPKLSDPAHEDAGLQQ